jgi:acyl-CoA thioesterase
LTEEHPNRERLDALFRSDAYMRALGMRLEDWGRGWARVGYTPVEEHRNFSALVHGGAVFSLGDAAFAVASNSWGRLAVALSIEVHYLAVPAVGAALRGEAIERSRTRRTASYLIEVAGEDGLIASLHAMVYRTGRWHLGEDAWPDDWRAAH